MFQCLSKSCYLLTLIVASLSTVGCDKGMDPKEGNASAGSARSAADLPKLQPPDLFGNHFCRKQNSQDESRRFR